jgi:hypothetical protein
VLARACRAPSSGAHPQGCAPFALPHWVELRSFWLTFIEGKGSVAAATGISRQGPSAGNGIAVHRALES